MRVQLRNATAIDIGKKLVELRRNGGVVTQGRVLTLVVCTDGGRGLEPAIAAATAAAREHPCRVIVVGRVSDGSEPRMDAEIRLGGDAGASEVLILALHGPLADHQESVIVPFLLPDTPIVVWWPTSPPEVPAKDPVGRLAVRRLTDATNDADPKASIASRSRGYTPGDTDLAWGRITYWRALLVSALDQTPHEPIESASVSGLANEPALDLLAGWLASRIDGPVQRSVGELRVAVQTRSQTIELVRPQEGRVATLRRTGKPDSLITLARRDSWECLAEELRRLDPDEIYHSALDGITKVEYV